MEVRPGYKQTEVGVIPEDWEVRPVGQMGDVVTGKALAVNAPGEPRPYLRTKNVFDGRIVIDDVLTMPMTNEQFAHFRLRNGDVLLNEGQSLELVGRCSLYSDEYPEPCAIQNQLLRFRARAGVSGVFASYLFRRCQQTGVFAKIALQTTSIAHLGGSRFERLLLAWPREEREQRAIASALSDVDALLGALDRLIAKKRDLKQAAMQQLLTGQTRLPGFHGEWEVKRLGDVAEMSSGGTPLSSVAAYYDGEIPWVSIADMTKGGKTISGTERNLTVLGFSNSAAQMFPAGTVLYAMYASIGECSIAGIPLCTSQAILGIRPRERLRAEFLYYYLVSLKPKVKTLGQQGTQANLNKGMVQDFRLGLPAVEEQAAIAAVLSDMDAELAALEARRDKTRALKQAMMQELLTGRTRLV
jgi:type I restriction enzyme S subunit